MRVKGGKEKPSEKKRLAVLANSKKAHGTHVDQLPPDQAKLITEAKAILRAAVTGPGARRIVRILQGEDHAPSCSYWKAQSAQAVCDCGYAPLPPLQYADIWCKAADRCGLPAKSEVGVEGVTIGAVNINVPKGTPAEELAP